VVVTGMGIYCPIGNSLDEVWNALITGKSGTGPIARFDPRDLDSKIAGEVKDFNQSAIWAPKRRDGQIGTCNLRRRGEGTRCTNASLEITQANSERIGVLIGTAMGGMETIERELDTLDKRGPRRVSPFFVPMFLADMASGYVSIVFGAKGPNFSTLSACASAAHAIGESVHIIRRGDADVMIAGGSEAAVTRGSVAGFDALRARCPRGMMNLKPRAGHSTPDEMDS
jgi:3-oxoacyl-[acyl-carrier-protein] synthase II